MMQKKITFAYAFISFCAAIAVYGWHAWAQKIEAPSTLNFEQYEYLDKEADIGALIYFPQNIGEWAVEDPWRKADVPLTSRPKIFVRSYFQAVSDNRIHGLVRVITDLEDIDCASAYAALYRATDMAVTKSNEIKSEKNPNIRVYVTEQIHTNSLVTGVSKILCSGKKAIEIAFLVPNEPSSSDVLNNVMANLRLRIGDIQTD